MQTRRKPRKIAPKVETRVQAAWPIGMQRNGKVALHAGANPRIAMGDGDAPVQACIAAMPDVKATFSTGPR